MPPQARRVLETQLRKLAHGACGFFILNSAFFILVAGAVAGSCTRTCSLAGSHSALKSQPRNCPVVFDFDPGGTNIGLLMNGAESVNHVQKIWLAIECIAMFLGVPAAVAAQWVPVPVIPVLLVMTVGCWLTLQWRHKIRLLSLLRPKVPGHEWRRVLAIYMVAVPCLLGLLWLIDPSVMFFLMCRHTGFWLLIMFAYPVFSVFPQELVYRAFFFERYRPLFGRGAGMVLASAAAFGFSHIVFHNYISVALTFAGGWLFATTYRRTSSLVFVSAEHALYGCAIFTIGYGQYFFDRMLWPFR